MAESVCGRTPSSRTSNGFSRPQVQSFEGDRIAFKLDEALTYALNRLASANGVTLNMLLLAGYKILLHLYTGQEDIVVGTPTAGRPHVDLENVVGMFVNILALRSYPTGRTKAMEYIASVKSMALQAYEHQQFPFEELVHKVIATRDPSRSPLFDTMFVLQNYDDFSGKESAVPTGPASEYSSKRLNSI